MGAALTAAALATDADRESFKTLVPKTVVQHWTGLHGAAIERYDNLMDELTPLEAPGLPILTVALGELRGLARCPSALPAAAPLPPP